MITLICLLIWLVVGFAVALLVGAFMRVGLGEREE